MTLGEARGLGAKGSWRAPAGRYKKLKELKIQGQMLAIANHEQLLSAIPISPTVQVSTFSES